MIMLNISASLALGVSFAIDISEGTRGTFARNKIRLLGFVRRMAGFWPIALIKSGVDCHKILGIVKWGRN